MLGYFSGHWDYWNLPSKVTFDGEAKRITVNPGVTTLDIRTDVYSRWVDWRALYGNSIWEQALRYTGLDAIPGGQTGDVYFLYNGWKLVIDFNQVRVSGVLYSDDFSTPYYSASLQPLYAAAVSALVNTVTTLQTVVTGDIANVPTAVDNAVAVWGSPAATQLVADIGFVKAIEGGRWKIIANQMIFYDEDNTTEVARFDLKAANGQPTMNNPMERVRV